MSVTAERKQEIIKDNARTKTDTGSPEVQVAILTERIANLTEHFKTHAKDNHSPARPADAGQQAPLAARLSEARGQCALHRADRQARPSQIKLSRRPCGAASHIRRPQFGGAGDGP